MKILVITNLYPPYQLGGYEIACRNVVAGLKNLGHEVHVLTSPSHIKNVSKEESVFRRLQLRSFQPVEFQSISVRVESCATNYTNTSVILEHIKEFDPDCVFLFNIYGLGGLAILDALNTLNFPWVMYLMDRIPEMLRHNVNPAILSLFNAYDNSIYRNGKFISISRHLLAEIQTMCNTKFTFNTDFIPAWSDFEGQMIIHDHQRPKTIRFVHAGALQPHKGIHHIIEATSHLKNQGISNFTVDIYGEGEQGYYIDMCKQHQVSDLISFNGLKSQNELKDIYKESDAFLFPTHEREPFAFAPVEAAAMGCVPIMTNTCGNSERFVGNVHCFKINKNSDSLAEVMKNICVDPSILSQISINTQVLTREDLSFKHCLGQIENTLRSEIFRKNDKSKPTWQSNNLSYLKHNLAVKFTNQ